MGYAPCLCSWLCAAQWPLNKACRFILEWFRKHTFAAVKKLCICCLNSSLLSDGCRPFLSAVLDLTKAWRAPGERLQWIRSLHKPASSLSVRVAQAQATQLGMFCRYMNRSDLVSQVLKGYRQFWVYMFIDTDVCL